MPVIINGSTGITNVNGSASTPAETGTDTDTGIYYGTNTVGLATNGTNALFIDASQNVGIGTSSPAYKLDVSATSFIAASVSTSYSGAGNIRIADASTTSGSAPYIGSVGNNLTFGRIGTAEYMRIDSSGNVGIGTSSNASGGKLEVNGGHISSALSGKYLNFGWSGSNAYIQATDVSSTGYNLIFYGGASERMRIGSDGAVFMNTTSNWSGNAILNVVGPNWVVSGYSTGTATNTGAFLSRVDNTNCRLMMFYYGATTNVGYITTNGTTTSYGSASDYRLKENIAPMTGALAKVALLKPVTYTWKSDGSDGQGFIAHELQEVVPNCVAGEKDAVDAEGNPQYQGVDTSFLVATLTAAIQEQQALITALTARIEALETK